MPHNRVVFIFHTAAILAVTALVLAIVSPLAQIATPDPVFHYTEDNGRIAPACVGDWSVTAHIIGESDGFRGETGVDKSLSLVFIQARNTETGEVFYGQIKRPLSNPSTPASFDFENTVVFDKPLVAGHYDYSHYFFNVTTQEGATRLRGFESEFEVNDCTGKD